VLIDFTYVTDGARAYNARNEMIEFQKEKKPDPNQDQSNIMICEVLKFQG
jgi:hypothetical protein